MAVEEPHGSIWIINPDLLTLRIAAQERLSKQAANLEAVKRIERWLFASIRTHQTIGVETVLSTSKYRRLVKEAHSRGFRVRLIYVALRSAELNIERVRIRAAKGGHDAPAEKIRARRIRSFQQLSWFLQHADTAQIYDNSGAAPELLLTKNGNAIDL